MNGVDFCARCRICLISWERDAPRLGLAGAHFVEPQTNLQPRQETVYQSGLSFQNCLSHFTSERILHQQAPRRSAQVKKKKKSTCSVFLNLNNLTCQMGFSCRFGYGFSVSIWLIHHLLCCFFFFLKKDNILYHVFHHSVTTGWRYRSWCRPDANTLTVDARV